MGALAAQVGWQPACRALGVSRATVYRRRRPPGPAARHPQPARALAPTEQAAVLAQLHSPRFVDLAPREIYATLLDEGHYLCSPRTMYRLLEAAHEGRERRNQLRHAPRPELLATRPNEVWSWDITKLLGPATWTYYYLYLLAAGRLLKKKGHLFGFELGHGFGDNHGWLYPLLWSYGGREIDRDGKTVLIDSSETAKAVDFCRKFFQETMLEDVLGWTDVNNNKAFLGEQISCTNNASSILVVAKRDSPEIAKVTDHSLNPQAPDQAAAKAFLRWLYDDKQLSRWLTSGEAYYAPFLTAYDNHPMWNPEPRYLPYKESLKTSRLHGWPGPPSHAMSESVAKYVLVDMFAKACRGDSTKDVTASAAAQLKQIYKAK